jgi:hypothetical protein
MFSRHVEHELAAIDAAKKQPPVTPMEAAE